MENGFNEHNRPVARDISIALSEKKVNSEIKKNRITRGLYIAGGVLFPLYWLPWALLCQGSRLLRWHYWRLSYMPKVPRNYTTGL